MEKRNEVEKILGKENVKRLLDEVDNGHIDEDTVKTMSLAMGRGVHGVFVNSRGKHNLNFTVCEMLDRWYRNTLFEHVEDGKTMLLDILENEHIGLKYLARQMKKKQN